MAKRDQENPATAQAVPTQVSGTTPEKVLKKSRIENDDDQPRPRRLWETQDMALPNTETKETMDFSEQPDAAAGLNAQSQPILSHLGETGECPDELVKLRCANQRLRDAFHDLKHQKEGLETTVAELREQLSKLSLRDDEEEGLGGVTQDQQPASDDAARKRLGRICSRSSTGIHGSKKTAQ